MKVLEICEAYGGGVKRQIDYLNRFENVQDIDMITLVSSRRDSDIPRKYLVDNRMSDFPKHIFKFMSVIPCLHQLIVDKNIQIVHAHSTIAGITMVLYKMSYRHGLAVIYTPHAYYSEVSRGFFKDGVLKLAEKFMSRFFTKVIHVSDQEQQYALSHGIVKQDKAIVINNGVPKPMIQKTTHQQINFVNVARCDYQKNPELFIQIAKVVTKTIPNTVFTWVGDGKLLNKMQAKVISEGLETRVKFVGYRKDPYEYLIRSDIYVSTSRYEGQPFSVLEAISEKMPLIITDVIGHRELVDGNGILLTDDILNDEKRLVDSFQTVITDEDAYAAASFKLFSAKYDVMTMVKRTEDIYLSGVVK